MKLKHDQSSSAAPRHRGSDEGAETHRPSAAEDYHTSGIEANRSMQGISEEDLQRILRAAFDEYRKVSGELAPLAPGFRGLRVPSVARKAGHVVWVTVAHVLFWSGVAAALFGFGMWTGTMLTA